MSHSVVQNYHLKSAYVLIFGWIIAKLLLSKISKHPVDPRDEPQTLIILKKCDLVAL